MTFINVFGTGRIERDNAEEKRWALLWLGLFLVLVQVPVPVVNWSWYQFLALVLVASVIVALKMGDHSAVNKKNVKYQL